MTGDRDAFQLVSDRITVLEFGRVIATGTPAEIQSKPKVLDAYLGGSDDVAEPAGLSIVAAAPTPLTGPAQARSPA